MFPLTGGTEGSPDEITDNDQPLEANPVKYRDNTLRAAITATVLSFGCTIPQLAMAQGANSLPDGPVACNAFRRVGNGSWTVLRPETLHPQGVPLSLAAGQIFAPNQMYDGFEVTAILDRDCGNR
jgi:hypothetical protein